MSGLEENKEAGKETTSSTVFVALVRLAFPTAVLLLTILYVENTYGRISIENLYYPYFLIIISIILLGTVYIHEIRYLYNYDSNKGLLESIKKSYTEWNRSVGFVIAGLAYLSVINVIGFFISSFLGMIVIMLIGGRRDPKLILGSTIATLVLVYVLFVMVMGLNPPQGIGI